MTYIRKTVDEYRLFVDYGEGWYHETTEPSWKELRARVKEYRTNCPEHALKTRKVRIPKNREQYRQEVETAERKRKGAAIQPRLFGIMLARKPKE